MAGELQASFRTGVTCYFLVRDRNGNIWNAPTSTFVTYVTGSYSGFPITATEQGTASAYYTGNFPSAAAPGAYNAVLKQQLGANPAETDTTVDAGSVDWNGTNVAQLADIAVSGVIDPIILPRNWMVKNYPLYLKQSSDHITPLTSGVVSGQISKDGGAFGVLQSGAFTEVGLGVYNLQALTSGDLNCNTCTLVFTATAVSGGASDPLVQSFLLQRVSGH